MNSRTFLAITAVIAVFLGIFLNNPFLLSMLALAALTLIVTTGLNLLLGFAGQISLGHAGFVALGAYISALLTIKFNINPWLSIFTAAILSSLIGAIIGYPTLKLKSHYLAMATLAIGEIINILITGAISITGGPQGLTGIPMLSILGFTFDDDRKFYFLAWFAALFLMLVSINLTKSRFGRALQAIKSKEIAAESFGINVHMYKVAVFTLSVFYASLAGGLFAFYMGFISPSSFGITNSIEYVVMVVLGGMGSFFGVLVSTIILSILPGIFSGLKEFWPIADGFLLVFAMMFLPDGLKKLFSWIKQ